MLCDHQVLTERRSEAMQSESADADAPEVKNMWGVNLLHGESLFCLSGSNPLRITCAKVREGCRRRTHTQRQPFVYVWYVWIYLLHAVIMSPPTHSTLHPAQRVQQVLEGFHVV